MIRHNRPLEAPGDTNKDADVELTENEFAQMKEMRENGMVSKDVAFELKKTIGIVNRAWGFQTFQSYKGTDTKTFDDLEESETAEPPVISDDEF